MSPNTQRGIDLMKARKLLTEKVERDEPLDEDYIFIPIYSCWPDESEYDYLLRFGVKGKSGLAPPVGPKGIARAGKSLKTSVKEHLVSNFNLSDKISFEILHASLDVGAQAQNGKGTKVLRIGVGFPEMFDENDHAPPGVRLTWVEDR